MNHRAHRILANRRVSSRLFAFVNARVFRLFLRSFVGRVVPEIRLRLRGFDLCAHSFDLYFSVAVFPAGRQSECSTAFSSRSCAAAFAGVVDLDFTPPGVLTDTLEPLLFAFRIVTGINSQHSIREDVVPQSRPGLTRNRL